ncbi:putative bifunctional diguanylate cyclase/phosphodiesterase [Novosphingobium sp.]|uniref:putative bifunctional diguanylate cyclase/phosphodiesterase n=1 Tax=Novosphingobium sp. TaxID=1874826 RepID=UPI0035685299
MIRQTRLRLRHLARNTRSLGARVARVYIGLLIAVMTVTIIVASSGISLFAHRAAERDLAANARVFEQIIASRQQQMADAGAVVALDFGFREAFATGDRATLSSALASLRERTGTREAAVISLDGEVIASAGARKINGTAILSALDAGENRGVAMLDGDLALAAAVPIELPDLAGWLVLFNTLGPADLAELAHLSAVEVSGKVLDRSRMPSALAAMPLASVETVSGASGQELAQVSALKSLESGLEPRLILTHSLATAMQGFRQLQLVLALIALAGAAIGAWLSIRMARGIARPLHLLAKAARKYGAGDVAKVQVEGDSEVRSLARSFNAMVDAVEERERQITHASLHDSLTGMPNRRFFLEKLDRAMVRQSADHRTLVAFIDIDDFKAINDTMGHPLGDSLLRNVANTLQARFPDAMVARFGGDEFGLLMTGIDTAADCANLARTIDTVLNREVVIDGQTMLQSASFGIAIGPQDANDADALLKCADLALFRAKSDGKATCHFFESTLDEEASRRRRLEIDMRRAIREGQFELYFQPLYSLVEDRVKGFEALMRWPHPDHGMISPVDFIPIAEESGMIVQLGEWAIREACAHAASWPGELSVAVNISPRQLQADGLNTCVVQSLATTGLPADRLELEITESVFIGDVERTLQLLHALKSLGVRVALDDFGTGYSSLAYLRSFPFNKLKIDQSFVRALAEGGSAHAIVRAITTLADALGIETLAEGVETSADLESLRGIGCNMIQGYFISRPVNSRDVPALLHSLAGAADLHAHAA